MRVVLNTFYLQTVDSTMDEALIRFREGVEPPIVVVSEKQLMGRGQFNREWESTDGGLYFSLLLNSFRFDLLQVPSIIQQVAFCVQTLIYDFSGFQTEMKLPNDIIFKGKKLGGILMESRTLSGSDSPEYLIVGIGLNVNQVEFQGKFSETAISLRMMSGRSYVLKDLTEKLTHSLLKLFE